MLTISKISKTFNPGTVNEKKALTDLSLHLEPGDGILLCSDGISGVLTPPELLEAMTLEPDEGCALLERMVLEKGIPEQDNYTGVLLRY